MPSETAPRLDYRTGLPVPAELRGTLYSPRDLLASEMARIDAEFSKATKGAKPPRLFSTPAERMADLDREISTMESDAIEEALAALKVGAAA